MGKIKVWFVRWLPDSYIMRRYILAGSIFGDIESYGYMGQVSGFWWYWRRWNFWETEVIRRGYRTTSLDDFILIGGYGAPDPVMRKLSDGEKPVAHSEIRKAQLEGGQKLEADIKVNEDGSFSGTYTLPSTEEGL